VNLSVVQTKVIKMPQTENRKIIRIGKTSLGVILPKAWLRYFALEAGDNLEVVCNGKVTIKPTHKTPSNQEVEVTL